MKELTQDDMKNMSQAGIDKYNQIKDRYETIMHQEVVQLIPELKEIDQLK